MQKKGWKITAVFFIVLSMFSLTALARVVYNYGKALAYPPYNLACNQICDEKAYDSETFYYDLNNKVCSCFQDGKEIYSEEVNLL
jgi:hypothetical protein